MTEHERARVVVERGPVLVQRFDVLGAVAQLGVHDLFGEPIPEIVAKLAADRRGAQIRRARAGWPAAGCQLPMRSYSPRSRNVSKNTLAAISPISSRKQRPAVALRPRRRCAARRR
jgi:hypothetical protein